MSGQQVAAVLDAESTLEEALHKVAQRAEDHYYESESHPCRHAQLVFHVAVVGPPADESRHNQHQHASANGSFPALARTYPWEELMPAKQRAAAVGSRVVGPQEYEYAQGQQVVVDVGVAGAVKCHYVYHGEG